MAPDRCARGPDSAWRGRGYSTQLWAASKTLPDVRATLCGLEALVGSEDFQSSAERGQRNVSSVFHGHLLAVATRERLHRQKGRRYDKIPRFDAILLAGDWWSASF